MKLWGSTGVTTALLTTGGLEVFSNFNSLGLTGVSWSWIGVMPCSLCNVEPLTG